MKTLRFLLGTKLDDRDVKQFSDNVRGALGNLLRRPLDFKRGDFAELWREVRGAFASSVPKNAILIARSSYLDPGKTSYDDLAPEEKERFERDVNASLLNQRRQEKDQSDLDRDEKAFKAKLDELHQLATELGKRLEPCTILRNINFDDETSRTRLAHGLAPTPPAAPARSDQPDPESPGQRSRIYQNAFDDLRSTRLCAEGRLQDTALFKNLHEASNLAFSLADITQQLDTASMARSEALDAFVGQVQLETRHVAILVNGSTIGTFTAAQAQYLTMDAGFLWAPALSRTVPYLGANLYLRPLNKDVPLRQVGGWGRRFAFTLGLTIKSIADSGETRQTRKDLIDNYSLVLGAGLRLTDSVRLGTGVLLFLKEDRNPLVNREKLAPSPYLSLSLDWDVAKSLQTFTKIFGNP